MRKSFIGILSVWVTILSCWGQMPWRGYVVEEMKTGTSSETVGRYSDMFVENIVWLPGLITDFEPGYNDGVRGGLWGLTIVEARHYGLLVDTAIDERFIIEKASRAACRYIKDLLREYNGDTIKALNSFVNTALVRENDENFTDECFYRCYIDREWVANFAQKAAMVEDSIRNMKLQYEEINYDTIVEPMSEERFVPIVKPEPKPLIYVVRQGDNLSRIAQKYNCSVRDLKKWNKLKSDMIRAGQKLKIIKKR
ncbi:MAG: lytic transglycosylase [Paludibacteraceae bacterium]|nr:lytic transglycosylase [Paludibacteraceae bacterium]